MATIKAQLDHLKKSVNTKISNFQTNLESNLTRQISVLDSKSISKTSDLDSKLSVLDSKTSDLDSKISALDSKISALESEMNSKFDTLETDVAKLKGKFNHLLIRHMPASVLPEFLD